MRNKLSNVTGPSLRLSHLALAVLTVCGSAAADEQPASLEAVTVSGSREDVQGSAATASEGTVTSPRLRSRPLLRAGDIMETVPGLVATQHSGEGKANQYFLRGFNLDHGTDFATYIDDVPINLPSHAHGQGYTDLYFLIPELLDSLKYRKGPYYAQEGDFATAGSVRMRTINSVPSPYAQVELGSYGYRRALAVGSTRVRDGNWLFALERVLDDGPWAVKQNLKKLNLVSKFSQGNAANGWNVGISSYDATWVATDQVPERAIQSGLIDRFGTLDPTNGGQTRRVALNANWVQSDDTTRTQVSAWAMQYRFDLFSNFTYFTRACDTLPLALECTGNSALDQFQQSDRRNSGGLSASHQRTSQWLGRPVIWKIGTDLRHDAISQVGLYDTSARAVINVVRQDKVGLSAGGLWSDLDMQIAPAWRAVVGARWDHRRIDVHSSIPVNGGKAQASLLTPKASLIYTPSNKWDFYANWGQGFHSNDARGAVIKVDPRDTSVALDPARPLVKATGYEIGARTKPVEGLAITASAWALKLDSELLFVGDAGTTEASRASSRRGLELAASWQPSAAWQVDADLASTRSRFRDDDPVGNLIPGSVGKVAGLGLTHNKGPWSIGLRVRYFGKRPLLEDGTLTAAASTTVNLKTSYRFNSRLQASLEVFNLLNRANNDIEYAYASRLPGEPAYSDSSTASTRHIHPSAPRSIRVGLKGSL